MASVTIPVPHPGAVINQDILTRLQTRGFFLGQSVFASLVEYMAPSNGMPGQSTIPTKAGLPKYFTSLSNLGIFIDGSLVLDGPYAAAFSDGSFSIYSQRLAEFYRGRVIAKDPQFAAIPRLVIRELPDAEKLNFTPDIGGNADALRKGRVVTAAEQPWSFGFLLQDETGPIERGGIRYRATFPSNHGLKYENGLPVTFDYQAYDKAFPLETIVQVGGGGGSKGTPAIKSGVNVRQSLLPAMLGPDDSALAAAVLSIVEVK